MQLLQHLHEAVHLLLERQELRHIAAQALRQRQLGGQDERTAAPAAAVNKPAELVAA